MIHYNGDVELLRASHWCGLIKKKRGRIINSVNILDVIFIGMGKICLLINYCPANKSIIDI